MTDTHSHLYDEAYEAGGVGAVERAIAAGVRLVMLPGVDMKSLAPMRALHERYPHNTLISIGLHPTELGEKPQQTLDEMERMLDAGAFDAIGEVGIDLYWDKSRVREQKDAFRRQAVWARDRKLPLMIHCREGLEECLEVLEDIKPDGLPEMVFHSFTGNMDDVRRIREVCDPWFGINGVVTFKNAPALREALPEIGIERIVLETDSPYLTPVPHRGERNESAYIPLILHKVADILGISPEEAERITDANACRFFGRT